MNSSTASPAGRLCGAAERVLALCDDDAMGAVVARLDDDELLSLMVDASTARDAVEVILAAASAEAARRSARELGYAGLAQRKGHRNVTSLVQNITGQTRADVRRTLRAGDDLVSAVPVSEQVAATPIWLSSLREALSSGRVGQAQFHAIRGGLGDPPIDRYPDLDPDFLPETWAAAVEILLAESSSMPVEELRNAARIARDRLDPVGVTLRFEERFAARSFRTC